MLGLDAHTKPGTGIRVIARELATQHCQLIRIMVPMAHLQCLYDSVCKSSSVCFSQGCASIKLIYAFNDSCVNCIEVHAGRGMTTETQAFSQSF